MVQCRRRDPDGWRRDEDDFCGRHGLLFEDCVDEAADVGGESGPGDVGFLAHYAGVVCAEEDGHEERWGCAGAGGALDDAVEVWLEEGRCVAGWWH